VQDQDLDKLFKQKLGANRPQPFNAANWQAMQEILGSQPKVAPFYVRSAAVILTFALLSSAALLWQNTASQSQPPEVNQNKSNLSLPADEKLQQKKPKSQPIAASTQKETPKVAPGQKRAAPRGLPVKASAQEVLPQNKADLTNSGRTVQSPTIAQEEDKSNSQEPPVPPAVSDYGTVESNEFNPPETAAGANNPAREGIRKPSSAAEADAPETEVSALTEAEPTAKNIEPMPAKSLGRYQKKHELFVSGGTSVNTSYSANQSGGWHAGLGYRFRFHTRWALRAEALYNRTGDMGLQVITDSVFFGFGRTEVRTQRHYKNIASLRLPINLEFNLNPAHQLSVGAYADVPLSVRMDLHRSSQSYKGAKQEEQHRSSKPRAEFNALNFGLQAAYFYRVLPQLSIGLRANYGLTDLTNNNHKNFEHNHRLLQADLTLRYRLF
jgi:hypothetical protein